MRWDATKEVTFVWTDRLMPAEDGNEINDIERRTDLIEAQVIKHAHSCESFRLHSPCYPGSVTLRRPSISLS